MRKLEKIALFVFNVLIIAVLLYSTINGNNCNVAELKAVMCISLVINLLLMESMLIRIK